MEVTNFHADIAIENEFRDGGTEELRKSNGMLVEVGGQTWAFAWPPSRRDRAWDHLATKFIKYKQLANQLDVPYIVGLAVEFVAATLIEPKDVLDAVHNSQYGLFASHPEVSGLYHFAIKRVPDVVRTQPACQ